MIGLDNPLHILMLLGVLLLVFGARRLPEMGRSLGAGLRGFKQELSGDAITSEPSVTPQAPQLAAAPVGPVSAAEQLAVQAPTTPH